MADRPGFGLELLDRFGDDAGEALWQAGLAMLEQAAVRGREGAWGRYQHFPAGELRRLRRDVARALLLCRQATILQAQVSAELRALTRPDLAGDLLERLPKQRRIPKQGTIPSRRTRRRP